MAPGETEDSPLRGPPGEVQSALNAKDLGISPEIVKIKMIIIQ
jgi:hypothetical protein